jgi:Glycosyltransferase (GlcNAc)
LSIFVSVASYCDAELVPTIQDCITKARHPQQLRFGVCWQHADGEDISPLYDDPRVDVLDVDWRDSRGACWARAEIMKLYRDEDYFLQLDSHHRFVQDWDIKLIGHLAATASPKPIITAYPPAYTPGQPLSPLDEPTLIVVDRFTDDGLPLFRQATIPDWVTLRRPVKARFLAAGFLFTIGSFVHQVPYDPSLYFDGEEITLAVRAYTWGYDLFHPPEVLLWHYYLREHRPKHWSDHSDPAVVERVWWKRDRASRRRIGNLLRNPSVGRMACGPVRTVAEYEAYAGIDFRNRTISEYALAGAEPPDPGTALSGAIEVTAGQRP